MTWVFAMLLGLASGVVAALCGVGGGIIMVPVMIWLLGLDYKMAVATSLAVIIPTAIAATGQNWRGGLVNWKLVLAIGIGATVAAWFAAEWMRGLRNEVLTKMFAVLLIATGIQLWFRKEPVGAGDGGPATPVGTGVVPLSDGDNDDRGRPGGDPGENR